MKRFILLTGIGLVVLATGCASNYDKGGTSERYNQNTGAGHSGDYGLTDDRYKSHYEEYNYNYYPDGGPYHGYRNNNRVNDGMYDSRY